MLAVLGQVDVLDTDNGLCRICSLKHTSISSEDESYGTLRCYPMKIAPEHWIPASVSPVRLVDRAGSESVGSSPQSNYTLGGIRSRQD